MCYSILVETNLTKLERDFRAAVDFASFAEAYRIRAEGLESIKIPRAIDAYLLEAHGGRSTKARGAIDSPLAQTCQLLAERYQEDQRAVLNDKVAVQQGKVLDLKAKLAKRWSKTNQQLLERAERVQAKAERDIAHLASPLGQSDSQVFQYSYCPVIVNQGGQNRIKLMRYQLRPRHATTEAPSNINMFNARLDALETRRSWQPLLGRSHGLVLLNGFYEWVPHPDTGKSAIIRFFPDDREAMWVPCLYDRWQGDGYGIESFAIITDDPPPEVAERGHDRCPIYPGWQHIDAWLAGGSRAASYEILRSRAPVHYAGAFVTPSTTNKGGDGDEG